MMKNSIWNVRTAFLTVKILTVSLKMSMRLNSSSQKARKRKYLDVKEDENDL